MRSAAKGIALSLCAFLGGNLHTIAQSTPAASPGKGVAVSQDKAAATKLFESWKTPVEPQTIIGNIHYVGMSGVSSFLVSTTKGHVLIDSGFEDCVPQLCKNIEKIGFRLQDIKIILSSHAHADHTGGHALMKKLTGAKVVASAADAQLLQSGGKNDFSPFPKELLAYSPVEVDQIIQDGERISLGEIDLTAHLTPGHTKGATTWSMVVLDSERSYNIIFFSGVSIVEPTKLINNLDYPNIVTDYISTFAKLKKLSCDIFFAPHGGQFAMADKFEKLKLGKMPNPFIDPEGWRLRLSNSEAEFRRQLETEKLQTRN